MARSRRVEANFERAKSSLASEDYPAAVSELEAVAKDAPSYMDATSLLAAARIRLRDSVRDALDHGGAAETAGDWTSALKWYERAHRLDPSTVVEPEVTRVRDQMKQAAYKDYARALAEERAGHIPQAISLYERVVILLPPENPTYQRAIQRLAQLR
jgi:tetratricopeptide (TPR) repeat protein